jgi:hypothetical protein
MYTNAMKNILKEMKDVKKGFNKNKMISKDKK